MKDYSAYGDRELIERIHELEEQSLKLYTELSWLNYTTTGNTTLLQEVPLFQLKDHASCVLAHIGQEAHIKLA